MWAELTSKYPDEAAGQRLQVTYSVAPAEAFDSATRARPLAMPELPPQQEPESELDQRGRSQSRRPDISVAVEGDCRFAQPACGGLTLTAFGAPRRAWNAHDLLGEDRHCRSHDHAPSWPACEPARCPIAQVRGRRSPARRQGVVARRFHAGLAVVGLRCRVLKKRTTIATASSIPQRTAGTTMAVSASVRGALSVHRAITIDSFFDRHRGQQLAAPLPHHPACGSAPGGSRS